MDLSKVFDYILQDLLIATCEAYGLNKNSVKYLYSYLKSRQECFITNNVYEILSSTRFSTTFSTIFNTIFENIKNHYLPEQLLTTHLILHKTHYIRTSIPKKYWAFHRSCF